jgi:hypothetical protein
LPEYNFIIFGPTIKSYGDLKILGEVWAGRACVGANQQELTTCAKKGGQEEGKFYKEVFRALMQGQLATNSDLPPTARSSLDYGLAPIPPPFSNFLDFFNFYF